jgi:hypothetical protein
MFIVLLVVWCVLSLASLVCVWLFSWPRDVEPRVAARLATGAVVPGLVFQCELAMRHCSLRAGHRVVFAAYSMATLWPVSAGLLVGLVLAVASYVTLPPNTNARLLEGIRSMHRCVGPIRRLRRFGDRVHLTMMRKIRRC